MILFIPGLLFLALALSGVIRGKIGPPALYAATKGYDWGHVYRRNEERYWASIAVYLIISFVLFSVAIVNLFV